LQRYSLYIYIKFKAATNPIKTKPWIQYIANLIDCYKSEEEAKKQLIGLNGERDFRNFLLASFPFDETPEGHIYWLQLSYTKETEIK
jgi:hypothetical protein